MEVNEELPPDLAQLLDVMRKMMFDWAAERHRAEQTTAYCTNLAYQVPLPRSFWVRAG